MALAGEVEERPVELIVPEAMTEAALAHLLGREDLERAVALVPDSFLTPPVPAPLTPERPRTSAVVGLPLHPPAPDRRLLA